MTNTVLRPTDYWLNSDGLLVRYGQGSARDAVVGSPVVFGDSQTLQAVIDWKRLPTFQSANTTGVIYGDYPNACIPAGAVIESATLSVNAAFTGATAILNLGLVTAAGVEIDDDGLFNSTDGAVANLDGVDDVQTGTGALIGTVLATTGYLWASVLTASFTAGNGRLIVSYRMPEPVTHDGTPVYA